MTLPPPEYPPEDAQNDQGDLLPPSCSLCHRTGCVIIFFPPKNISLCLPCLRTKEPAKYKALMNWHYSHAAHEPKPPEVKEP